MGIIVEGTNLGDLVKRELDDFLSREKVSILSGQVLSLGEVLGKITKSTPTTGTPGSNTGGGTMTGVAAGAKTQFGAYTIKCVDTTPAAPGAATAHAYAYNTGTGAMGSITVGVGAKVGTYTLEIVAAVGNAGAFVLKYPDGSFCAEGNVASAFDAGGLAFTLADGTDYVVGDGFFIVVTEAASGAGSLWEVKTPSGEKLADKAVTGTPYASSQISFTINDSGTNFAVGDSFTVTVIAGSGKVRPMNLSGVDGSQEACGFAVQDYAAGSLKAIAFTSGGTYQIGVGDLVVGATSGAKASVQGVAHSSGTWAGGDEAGALILDNQTGTFEAENLNVGGSTNVATIGGNSSSYSPERSGVAIVREALIDPSFLVWPTGATADQKAAALAQLKALGILSDRPAA